MKFKITAFTNQGVEITEIREAANQGECLADLKRLGFFPTKITEANKKEPRMNLAQALKAKNRLAGELVRQQQILTRENSRREDSTSKVDRKVVWETILKLSEELGTLKGKITVANIGIYPMLERMAELKARIAYIASLPKREGVEQEYLGGEQRLAHMWDSFLTQEKVDALTAELQTQLNELQDKVDTYNATTTV